MFIVFVALGLSRIPYRLPDGIGGHDFTAVAQGHQYVAQDLCYSALSTAQMFHGRRMHWEPAIYYCGIVRLLFDKSVSLFMKAMPMSAVLLLEFAQCKRLVDLPENSGKAIPVLVRRKDCAADGQRFVAIGINALKLTVRNLSEEE